MDDIGHRIPGCGKKNCQLQVRCSLGNTIWFCLVFLYFLNWQQGKDSSLTSLQVEKRRNTPNFALELDCTFLLNVEVLLSTLLLMVRVRRFSTNPLVVQELFSTLPLTIVWELFCTIPMVVWKLFSTITLVVKDLFSTMPPVRWEFFTTICLEVWYLLCTLPLMVGEILITIPLVVNELYSTIAMIAWELLSIIHSPVGMGSLQHYSLSSIREISKTCRDANRGLFSWRDANSLAPVFW